MMNGPIDMSGERVNMPPTGGLQVIPDAAVEAAAVTLEMFWDVTPELARQVARTQLEAAAPHMLAGAWGAGYLALADDTFRDQELRKRGAELKQPTENPYTHDDTQGEK